MPQQVKVNSKVGSGAVKQKRATNNQNDKLKVTLAYRPAEGQPARLGNVMRILLKRNHTKQPQKKTRGAKP